MAARPSGFTLVEVLVALAVLAVVLVLAQQGLRLMTGAEESLGPRRQRLSGLQVAMATLERDLMQLASRPVRDGNGRPLPALSLGGSGGALIAFTRSGRDNPMDRTQADLVRIDYRLEGKALLRDLWPVLDRVPGTEPVTVRLLDGVTAARARLRTDDGRWHDRAPLPEVKTGPDELPPLPAAIEVTLEVEGIGGVRRLVPVPR